MLATTDLWFRYQDEPVLKGLTLDFSRHAVTGLVISTAISLLACVISGWRKRRSPAGWMKR